jgi:hypothetical protein
MSVCCECCVLSGGGFYLELITRPEESYRLWCVVCDLETSRMSPLGAVTQNKRESYVCCQTLMKVKWLRLRGEDMAFCKLEDGGLIPV